MEKVIRQIIDSKRVMLISHVRPDGDTIGSTIALKLALMKMGKQVEIFCDDTPPQKFNFLPQIGSYNIVESFVCDTAISIDCGDKSRLGTYAEQFSKCRNTINIDHHKSNDKFAAINLVDENAAATAIIIYDIIERMNVELDGDIATCLFTGISTDTGNFCHANTNKQCFDIAGDLISYGVDIGEITTRIYKSSPKCRTMLLAHCLQKARFFDDDSIAIMMITTADFENFGAKKSDTEGFIDNIIGILGVEVAASIMQNDANNYKVGFRSKRMDVSRVAADFGGGGHKLAAGCSVSGFSEDVIDKIVRAIRLEK